MNIMDVSLTGGFKHVYNMGMILSDVTLWRGLEMCIFKVACVSWKLGCT